MEPAGGDLGMAHLCAMLSSFGTSLEAVSAVSRSVTGYLHIDPQLEARQAVMRKTGNHVGVSVLATSSQPVATSTDFAHVNASA